MNACGCACVGERELGSLILKTKQRRRSRNRSLECASEREGERESERERERERTKWAKQKRLLMVGFVRFYLLLFQTCFYYDAKRINRVATDSQKIEKKLFTQ